jgi:hypothetical protein
VPKHNIGKSSEKPEDSANFTEIVGCGAGKQGFFGDSARAQHVFAGFSVLELSHS